MSRPFQNALLAAALLAASAASARPSPAPGAAPVYVAGSQYTAVYHQARGIWQLLGQDGRDLLVGTGDCPGGSVFPNGVWLLASDAQGRPELQAVSATALPDGAAERIPLRACDSSAGRSLSAPQTLIDWLTAHTGAVYLND